MKGTHRAMWALGDYPAVGSEVIPDLGACSSGRRIVRVDRFAKPEEFRDYFKAR